jgi:AraC-like DNA-binding protein
MLMEETFYEEQNKQVGREKILKLNCEKIVIEIIRYILDKKMFVEQLATNSTYFKDPRLVNVFSFIKNNLNGDLSNKALAEVAQVSEDYVGQYFKMLTGINPQDYIEYQRMEEAVNLLRTSNKSIKEIGELVGYKGTAYFCRRFKMMFGIPAWSNAGPDYAKQFNAIYPDLSLVYQVPLYPFFLEGLIGNRDMMLADGIHPSAAGVREMVQHVEAFLRKLPAKP